MTKPGSLKQRIARSFVILALMLSSFFSLVSYIAVEVIEAQVVDERLQKVSEQLIAQHAQNQVLAPPPDMTYYGSEHMPTELRNAVPGIYELMLEGRQVHALIREHSGNRFAIVQDMEEFEHLEFIFFCALGAGFVASALLAIVLGVITARHIVVPVSALADAVERNAGSGELPSLDARDEIGVLARAFSKRTEALEQFLMRERLFTGDVSHELRTPLTVILGAAEVLRAQLSSQPALLAVTERIRRVAAETAERVSALLLLSRLPERMDITAVEMNPLLQSEFDRCQYLLIGKPVQFRLEWSEHVWVKARPELIGIVIGNLIRNACQHTEQGIIRVSLSQRELVIEDQGPGIPKAVCDRLFERFVQGNNQSVEGTGLGLSIVKRVVDHLGWTIRLESQNGGGSRFVLSFLSEKHQEIEALQT